MARGPTDREVAATRLSLIVRRRCGRGDARPLGFQPLDRSGHREETVEKMKDLLTSPTRIVPFALTLAATACEAAPPNPPASQTQIEDSDGIHIVENARPETGSLLGW